MSHFISLLLAIVALFQSLSQKVVSNYSGRVVCIYCPITPAAGTAYMEAVIPHIIWKLLLHTLYGSCYSTHYMEAVTDHHHYEVLVLDYIMQARLSLYMYMHVKGESRQWCSHGICSIRNNGS